MGKYIDLVTYHLHHTPKRFIIRIIFQHFRFLILNLVYKNKKLSNLNSFEKRVYSQNGEDGILEVVFDKIGTTNKYFVEFGVKDAQQCNTRFFKEFKGWQGLWMDGDKQYNKNVKTHWITRENIEPLLKKYNVPKNFD